MDDIRKIQHGFKVGGFVLTGVSAFMTMLFGLTLATNWFIGAFIAAALVVASIASAYVWIFVGRSVAARNWIGAAVAGVGGLIFTTTDLTSNFGSVAWQRDSNVQQASVQNTKYEDSRAKVEENRANLSMWKAQLAKLNEENAWSATVKADGLRAQVEAADEAIRQEERRGGCGPRCLGLKRNKADLENRIATVELREDLTRRIAATQELVDRYREKAATVEKSESAALMQTVALASVATISLDPSQEAVHWTSKGVAWWVALFLAFGPIVLNYLGWMPTDSLSRLMATSPSTDLVPAAQPTTNTVLQPVIVNDSAFAKAIADLKSVQKFAELKAA